MPPQFSPETQQFDRDVQSLLRAHDPQARSLLACIYRTIRQFGLQTYMTEIDIFVEAYLRGVRYIRLQHRPIDQPKAWMRRTAYNIIRECKRDRLRYSNAALDDLMEQGVIPLPADPDLDETPINHSQQLVMLAFQSLSRTDQDLITWKIVDDLSWEQIRARLAAQGVAVSMVALRKRGQRALERLRQTYHALERQQAEAASH
jgi:DNA-directed RNA polymerase specialized sigma24 family protein